MDFLTLNSTTFTLMQGTTAVPGAVTYSGISAFFTPASYLLPGTEYTGTITTGAKSLAGIPLADNFVWKFTTGVAPTVISTSPVNLTTGVVLNKIVSATFSVSMDYLSLNETTFTLKQGTNVITGTVTYNGTTASFTPANDLLPGLEYSAMITTGAKSLQGIAMVNNYVWKFNTGVVPKVISTDPPNLATGVILNKAVTVAFNIPLDPLTLTAANVTLKQGTNVIAGAITYSGTTLTFTPANAFTPNTVYTGTITTGVKSVSGMPMASDYIWNFNTGISPIVISTDPVNLVTGVVLNNLSSI